MKILTAAVWPRSTSPAHSGSWLDSLLCLAAVSSLVLSAAVNIANQSSIEPRREEAADQGEEQIPSTLAPPTRELLIAAYGGAPYTYRSDVVVKKPGVHDFTIKDVGWDAQPFDHPIYYGARIARWFEGGTTGAMVDFTHSKVLARFAEEKEFSGTMNGAPTAARARLGDLFRKLEFTHGHNMLTLNGLMRLPAINTRLFPYVGAGAGVSLPHTEVQMTKGPGRTYEYQYAGPVVQALIGLELRVPRMSYFIEYKFSFALYEVPLTHRDGSILFVDLWHQLQRWLSGEPPPGGYLSTKLVSHQAIAGLGVRLGAAPAPAGGP